MTQEEKQLLLKDLCARLPYGVQLQMFAKEFDGKVYEHHCELDTEILQIMIDNEDIVYFPYLRPMSSMTEEEKNELRSLLWFGYPSDDYDNYSHRGIEIKNCLYDNEDKSEYDFEDFELLEEFLFKNHFDFHGLIEKGLALEAPKDMYVIK